MPAHRYRAFPPVALPDRRWPGRTITQPPTWCSVDLRDGNQALVEPMGPERKLRMFEQLVAIGFREIEVGFPSASQTELAFLRQIIEEDRVPEEVTLQVLTQARDELIDRTMESIRGASRAIVHVYNPTSTLQRRVVFGQDRAGIVEIAVRGVERIAEAAARLPHTQVVLEYSPESFTGTELDFALEICEAVMSIWQPSRERQLILNLPATVELATPNVYADQVEWFARGLGEREGVVLSVHPHNDRGTAVAAAELALMAGAQRVEGSLFGNGERTGNVDIVTLALNLLTQGVDPGLDLSDIDEVVRTAEYCTRLPLHPRHPYAGELVHTAFSGSHQDAIRKGLAALEASGSEAWEVPYLPIDPADIGRSYEAVIRINSQSGKGGVAHVMEREHGLRLPRRLQMEFARHVQLVADASGEELSSKDLYEAFEAEYLGGAGALDLVDFDVTDAGPGADECRIQARLQHEGVEEQVSGRGNGPIDAFAQALGQLIAGEVQVRDYHEHALGAGADATAAAYVELSLDGRTTRFGVGIAPSIVTASLRAVLCAMNRVLGEGG
ncbi:MAG: 2-isopropylmalate synthase [Deltaproteobacteria bacterium]|nr:2-isopropylmalate synthase [Deltaproteobacteria bacterium]